MGQCHGFIFTSNIVHHFSANNNGKTNGYLIIYVNGRPVNVPYSIAMSNFQRVQDLTTRYMRELRSPGWLIPLLQCEADEALRKISCQLFVAFFDWAPFVVEQI